MPNDMVFDAFMNVENNRGHKRDVARTRRAYVNPIMETVRECRILVITLGLVEVWHDARTGLRLNGMPPYPALRGEPDRFTLQVLDYQDILNDLEEIHAAVTKFGHPDFKILITVSPVPLARTFRNIDVLSANTYSKSVQRAAVETFVLKHSNVNYFPSFETVTLTDRSIAFDDDNRHVQRGVVAKIVDRFVKVYAPHVNLPSESLSPAPVAAQKKKPGPSDILARAKFKLKEKSYPEARELLNTLVQTYGYKNKAAPEADIRMLVGACFLKEKNFSAAAEQFRAAISAGDGTSDTALKCAFRLMSCGDVEGAKLAIEAAEKLGAPETDVLIHSGQAALQEQSFDVVDEVLKRLETLKVELFDDQREAVRLLHKRLRIARSKVATPAPAH